MSINSNGISGGFKYNSGNLYQPDRVEFEEPNLAVEEFDKQVEFFNTLIPQAKKVKELAANLDKAIIDADDTYSNALARLQNNTKQIEDLLDRLRINDKSSRSLLIWFKKLNKHIEADIAVCNKNYDWNHIWHYVKTRHPINSILVSFE
ncbi:MAG TPA: hypothetical protein VGJ00_00355 [Rhabdochlamydiaceae bacterium]|jgi:hypothetical protein